MIRSTDPDSTLRALTPFFLYDSNMGSPVLMMMIWRWGGWGRTSTTYYLPTNQLYRYVIIFKQSDKFYKQQLSCLFSSYTKKCYAQPNKGMSL